MTDEWWFFPLSRNVCKEGQLSWAFDETEEFFEAWYGEWAIRKFKEKCWTPQ